MKEHFTFTFPAGGGHLALAREWCRMLLRDRLPPGRLDPLLLALSEACANAIQHGKLKRVEIEVTRTRRKAELRIPRYCRGGQLHCIKSRRLRDVKPGGLGMRFIEKSVDRMAYDPDGEGGLTLVLTQRCQEGNHGD